MVDWLGSSLLFHVKQQCLLRLDMYTTWCCEPLLPEVGVFGYIMKASTSPYWHCLAEAQVWDLMPALWHVVKVSLRCCPKLDRHTEEQNFKCWCIPCINAGVSLAFLWTYLFAEVLQWVCEVERICWMLNFRINTDNLVDRLAGDTAST